MAKSVLTDLFGRTIDYLRVSVTDRCNFRCLYCMPPEGISLLPQDDILTFEEIVRVARIFLRLGGRKLRITGGEPLVRKNIVSLVGSLTRLEGLESLGLTTNGYFLKDFVLPLKKAGLKKINISLDSLSPSRFSSLTNGFSFQKVWEGIESALFAGFQIKINVVALQGMSEEEIIAFGEMAFRLPVEVRFIEFMPLCGTGWHPEWTFPIRKIREVLKKKWDLRALSREDQVAQTHRIQNGKGSVGFIASMTDPFCDRCSRLRLTADGKLRPCLFSNLEIDLKSALRYGESDAEVSTLFLEAVQQKPKGHELSFPIRDGVALPRIRSLGG